MQKKLWILLLASCVAVSALAIACGDDDNTSSSSSGGVNDGGNPDGNNTNPDGGDGGNGQCTFAGFVQGLLAQPSNSTPSTDLGDSCTPSTSQADFAPVFAHH